MTREEAIHILDNLKPTNTKSSFDAYVVGEAITMATKALEQESILDKIRTEIQKVIDTERDFTSENAKAQAIALHWCLELIDKCRK